MRQTSGSTHSRKEGNWNVQNSRLQDLAGVGTNSCCQVGSRKCRRILAINLDKEQVGMSIGYLEMTVLRLRAKAATAGRVCVCVCVDFSPNCHFSVSSRKPPWKYNDFDPSGLFGNPPACDCAGNKLEGYRISSELSGWDKDSCHCSEVCVLFRSGTHRCPDSSVWP